MTVLRCVSSKSNTCELMPFISDACSDVHPFAAAEHGGLGRTRKRGERGDRGVESLVTRAANRAAHPVDQRAPRLLADGERELVRTFRSPHTWRSGASRLRVRRPLLNSDRRSSLDPKALCRSGGSAPPAKARPGSRGDPVGAWTDSMLRPTLPAPFPSKRCYELGHRRSSLRGAGIAPPPGVRAHRGPLAGPRHRRHQRGLQRRLRRPDQSRFPTSAPTG